MSLLLSVLRTINLYRFYLVIMPYSLPLAGLSVGSKWVTRFGFRICR